MKASIVVAVLGLWGTLSGFSSDTTFDLEADQGGGGGYSYTGSPANHGMGCDQCHQGHVGELDAELFVDPPDLFSRGYVPGQVYQIQLRFAGERFGLERQGGCASGLGGCNRNGFVAEITDGNGASRGVLCPAGSPFLGDGSCADDSGTNTTLIAQRHAIGGQSLTAPVDCASPGAVPGECIDFAGLAAQGKSQAEIAAIVNAAVHGSTSWTMQWRAPGGGTGALHLWVGMVDGDGGTTVDPAFNDYHGDGVLMAHLVIPGSEGNGASGVGCDGGGAALGLWCLAAAGVVWMAWGRRSRA